jgi:sucrose PTS system EIIBCA or EIIBC component
MSNKIDKTAQQILDSISGPENIISAAHCATRLRLVLLFLLLLQQVF